jgi:hypothetical protein
MHILTVFTVCFHYCSPCGCDSGIGVKDVFFFSSDAKKACLPDEVIEERKALDVDGKFFLLDRDTQEFEFGRVVNNTFVPNDPAKDKSVEL